MIKRREQFGFTLVELMIAVTVFSLLLMVTLAGFLHIGRMFYKGVNSSRVQEVSRTIMDDVKADIRTNKGQVTIVPQTSTGKYGYYCIGAHRYTYALGKQIGNEDTVLGLRRDTLKIFNRCTNPNNLPGEDPADPAGGLTANILTNETKEYLATGMRINRFRIGTCDGTDCRCVNGLCNVEIHVVFNPVGPENDDLLRSPSGAADPATAEDALCTGSLVGSQFCATADLVTMVGNELTQGDE